MYHPKKEVVFQPSFFRGELLNEGTQFSNYAPKVILVTHPKLRYLEDKPFLVGAR